MKTWKKLFVVALCVCMTLSLAACGNGGKDDQNSTSGMSGTYENDGDVNLDDKNTDRNGDATDGIENMVDDAAEGVDDMVNDVTDGDAGTDGDSGTDGGAGKDGDAGKEQDSRDKKSESDRNENSR